MPTTPFNIHTGRDGILDGQSPDEVRAIVDALATSERAVVHFHGGLVKRPKGEALAARLDQVYRGAGAVPAFFVWESGLIETVTHNLHEIEKEKLFQLLLKRVLKHVVGKLMATPGQKAAGALPYPKDGELAVELELLREDSEPYADLTAPGDLDETAERELEQFERELERDQSFQAEAQAIAAQALPSVREAQDGTKGVIATRVKSERTMLSPEIVAELEADTESGAKGLVTTAKLIVHAGKVLVRTIRRLRKGRDHGVYPTVVEEILRELYVANVGAEIWHQMKKETADTFVAGGGDKGGVIFLERLEERLAAGARPRITLVGHSTGAVFIFNLLAAIARRRATANSGWPTDFAFESVVFLAPACGFERFPSLFEEQRDLLRGFRMFTMRDALESQDRLMSVVYPRSLLYFVSGVVEREPDGAGAFDLPLVGMERYYTRKGTYDQAEVAAARAYLAADPRRVVWSISDRGDGLRANSTSHGSFDDTELEDAPPNTTMESVCHLIASGAGG